MMWLKIFGAAVSVIVLSELVKMVIRALSAKDTNT